MLTEAQARRLGESGLYAYNHNLDTSENYYRSIITTRTYRDRLDTLRNVRKTGVTRSSRHMFPSSRSKRARRWGGSGTPTRR